MQRHGLRQKLNLGPNNPTIVASIHTDFATKLPIVATLCHLLTYKVCNFQRKNQPCLELSDCTKSTIKIENLVKIYKRKKKVIDNFRVEFKESEVSVILAENEAGKSTVLHLICGLTSPISGSVRLFRENPVDFGVSSIIGVSFQQDVSIGDLTVSEYLEFYSKLKGTSQSIARRESQNLIESLELPANVLCKHLNNQAKRILSIAIAFSADPKIVLLDEPTHGLEPRNAKMVWDFIKSQKEGKTIVIASPSGYEAENVGDHLVVLKNGRLVQEGSPDELKQELEIGYELKCHKSVDHQPNIIIEKFMQKLFPNAKIRCEDENLITFLLDDTSSKFPDAFKVLENGLADLGISKFYVEHVTLDEMLLRPKVDIVDDIPLNTDYFHDDSDEIAIMAMETDESGEKI
jgi:ABC-type multidrug transport system ATPase subunit